MTNYITEKDFRQAVLTKLSANQQKCLDYIVKQFTFFEHVYISQQAIAAAIGLSRKTVNQYIKHFCELNFLSKYRRFDKQFKKSNVYTLNSFFKEIKERLVQVLPSLKGWLGTPIYSALKEKVTISIKGVLNALTKESNISYNSSVLVSSINFKKAAGTLDIAMTHEEYMFLNNIAYFGEDMDLKKVPVNKLTDEQWKDINTPKTKQQIQQQKEDLTKKLTIIKPERPIKHLGKKEPHPAWCQFKFPGA